MERAEIYPLLRQLSAEMNTGTAAYSVCVCVCVYLSWGEGMVKGGEVLVVLSVEQESCSQTHCHRI